MQAKTSDRYLRVIAIFKLIKGLLLLFMAVGFLGLLHKDVSEVATSWITRLHVDPDNRLVGGFLARLGLITDKQIEAVTGFTLCYAAIFLTEGTGLFLKKRWAQYFTIVATGSFIPLELYELCRHFRAVKIVLLVINVGIVCFLAVTMRKERIS